MSGFKLPSKLSTLSRPGDKFARPRTPLARAAIEALEARTLFNAGGGWAGGGIVGQYYANSYETGTPAFTRTDDRIDFPSAAYNAPIPSPAGSNSTGFNSVSSSAFSVHWAGDLIPKFAETYTFTGFEDDTFKLQISPKGQNQWTTVINQTSFTGTNATGTYTFPTAGAEYDVKIDYAQLGSNWAAQLQWSSAHTPLETIESVNPVGISAGAATDYSTDYTFANAVSQSSPFVILNNGQLGGTDATTDAYGNPTEDFGFAVRQAYAMAGSYAVSGYSNTAPTITMPNTDAKVISPVSYNSSTHQFTYVCSLFDTSTDGSGIMPGSDFELAFQNTGGGVQDLKVMLPTAPDATTTLDPGLLFNPAAEALLETNYSIIRTMDLTGTNSSPQTTWSTRPSPFNVQQEGAMSWEDVVQLANETGKDLWINIPMMADTTYVTNLANLIKYGSDGTNPYTSTQSNPVFPGLNPNLHVYIEWSNETWNTGAAFQQSAQAHAAAVAAVANNTPEGQIINYNGQASSDETSKWTALKLQETSDIFRSVFGDAAMPGSAYGQNADPTIRPVCEWQADNNNGMLSFIDDYFDKSDPASTYTGTAHPVSYYFYGAGGTWYTAGTDDRGNSEVTQPDSGFDLTTPDPWVFSGTAGIVASGANGAPATPDGSPDQAYITGTGSFTEQFTLPASEYVDIYFNATGGVPVTVMLDSTNVGGSQGYVPGKPDLYGAYYGPGYDSFGAVTKHDTNDIFLTAGTHTVTFTGTGTGSQTGYFDNVEVGTVDGALQAPLTDISTQIHEDAVEANAFGLKDTAYEGGLLLGGSDLGGPGSSDITGLDQQAYLSPQSSAVVQQALANFQIDGGDLAVQYGSASEGAFMVTNETYNLTAGVNVGYGDATSALPVLSTYGTTVPAAIVATTPAQSWGMNTYDLDGYRTLSPGGWVAWAINVPTAGTYNIATDAGTGGTQQIFVDGNLIGSGNSGAATTAAPDSVTLTAGLHIVRVACLGTAFQVKTLFVNAGPAPAAGTTLAAFDFYPRTSRDQSSSVAPTGTNANSTVSSIQAGPGYTLSTIASAFSVTDNTDAPMDNLTSATTKQEYFQFTIAPQSGYTQSLSALNAFVSAYQHTMSTAVEYSTGGTFTVVSQTDINDATGLSLGVPISANLADIPALQNTTATVTFRIYLWGDNSVMAFGPDAGNDIAVVGTSTAAGAAVFSDFGFESPAQSGGFSYDTPGSPWTFAGNAGIQGNGSGFGAANAPEGIQTAFLEGSGPNGGGAMGSLKQSATFAAGTYVIDFQAASRASDGTSLQPIVVEVDGTPHGTITPSSTSFGGYASAPFTVTAGSHVIELVATVPNSSTFVDGLTISNVPAPLPTFGDFGFETPPQHVGGSGRLTYRPTGSPWTFTGNSGIQGNGSSLGAANALEGIQTAFLQGSAANGGGTVGGISQSLNFVAGTYAITFLAARRASDGGAVEPIQLYVNGVAVGSPIAPTSTSFGLYTTASFTVGAGNNVIQLLATDATASTTFVDAISVVP